MWCWSFSCHSFMSGCPAFTFGIRVQPFLRLIAKRLGQSPPRGSLWCRDPGLGLPHTHQRPNNPCELVLRARCLFDGDLAVRAENVDRGRAFHRRSLAVEKKWSRSRRALCPHPEILTSRTRWRVQADLGVTGRRRAKVQERVGRIRVRLDRCAIARDRGGVWQARRERRARRLRSRE